jgi:hypothetical protein
VFSRTSLLAHDFSSELCLHFWTLSSGTLSLFLPFARSLIFDSRTLQTTPCSRALFRVFDTTVASIMVTAGIELVLYPLPRKRSAYVYVVAWTCLQLSPRQRIIHCSYRSRCLEMEARSDCDIPSFRRHVTFSIVAQFRKSFFRGFTFWVSFASKFLKKY